jgi:hypothetical protein
LPPDIPGAPPGAAGLLAFTPFPPSPPLPRWPLAGASDNAAPMVAMMIAGTDLAMNLLFNFWFHGALELRMNDILLF